MAGPADNRSPDKRSTLVDSHEGFDRRLILVHAAIACLLLVLAGDLAFQQLFRSDVHNEQERQQNERRIIVPGPRGNIYDRNHHLLVGNRARLAVVLYLDELRSEFRAEFLRIRRNYRDSGDRDLPTDSEMQEIARVTVVQQYLDQVNAILGRTDKVDRQGLKRHFERDLLLPYALVDDLSPENFARLVEGLPVNSPLQIYTTHTRYYPAGSAAAHTLGYVGVDEAPESDAGGSPGEGLTTYAVKGLVGRDGLEKSFDGVLQGTAGYSIVRVDPAGYKVNPPLEGRPVRPGANLETSLDIGLQQAAEEALGDQTGAAVALDANTGEVLVLASKPDYDLNRFSPQLHRVDSADIEARQAWENRAISGLYPPGSTFKIVVSTAALRAGVVTPDDTPANCTGSVMIGGHRFRCDNGDGVHGRLDLRDAIAKSCDIYFYTVGLMTTADRIAAQADAFHLDRPTGIELPGEARRMNIPSPAWKRRVHGEAWSLGDTANMSIGQGFVLVTPLEMACFAASFARGELWTQPTLLHDPNRATQHTDPIGLDPADRAAIIDGMEACTQPGGTASVLSTVPEYQVPGVRIAGKTGTAQVFTPKGHVDVAWFICFAPIEHPRIAVAVAIEGDVAGENFGGGLHAAPVAAQILRAYFQSDSSAPADGTVNPETGAGRQAGLPGAPAGGPPAGRG